MQKFFFVLFVFWAEAASAYTFSTETYVGGGYSLGSNVCGRADDAGVFDAGFLVGNFDENFSGSALGIGFIASKFPFLCYDQNKNVTFEKGSDVRRPQFGGATLTLSHYFRGFFARLNYAQPRLGERKAWGGDGHYISFRLGNPLFSSIERESSGSSRFIFSPVVGFDYMAFHHRSCSSEAECGASDLPPVFVHLQV